MKNENEKYPDFLFHYTSIENLALILKNKTIRFNSLIDVDDPDEIRTSDTEGMGKYCYCSCWTDKEESIPFWKMYTKDMHGVMIKMKANPFNEQEQTLSYYNNKKAFKTYIPKEIFNENNTIVMPTVSFLRKVNYSDEKKVKVFDKLEKNEKGSYDFEANFSDIGKFKSKSWEFQSEWRYSIFVVPYDYENGNILINYSSQRFGCHKYYYDIKISDDAFNNIEIVLGPKMNDGEKLLVETICQKYAPNAKITESKIKIR